MTFDVIGAIELASIVAGKQPISQTLSDAQTLYKSYQAIQTKTFDPNAMAAAGTLEPVIAAVARSATLFDGLLRDPTQAPRVVALLKSVT